MNIWIARDGAHTDDEEFDLEHFLERHPEKEREFGALHLFYDKPTYNRPSFKHGRWEGGRVGTEIPSYMFPNIECGECLEFTAPDNFPEYLHWEGVVMNEELLKNGKKPTPQISQGEEWQ